jgi:FdhD protein
MNSPSDTTPAVRRPTTNVKISAIRNGNLIERPDTVATEEPMEIRIHGPNQDPSPVTVTMRTPGNDYELTVGLLYNEGIITHRDELKTVCYCTNVSKIEQRYNVVTVELASAYLNTAKERSYFSASACGVCGTTSIDDIAAKAPPVKNSFTISSETILALPPQMRPAQKLFSQTGGLHGAGIFDKYGNLEIVREDIGRHNALDKIIGHYFMEGLLPLDEKILVLSGRIGFELVQKAAMAQIPIIVAVSAPSSLAIRTAEELGITLIGFTRDECANIYSFPERIVTS